MKQTLYEKIKWAFIFWLARRLPDCKTITPTLGESLDRKLSLREKIETRLHLFTCDACARYLKQVEFLREAAQANNENLFEENQSINLSLAAKDRLKTALKSSTGFAF